METMANWRILHFQPMPADDIKILHDGEFRAVLRPKIGSVDEYGNILCQSGIGDRLRAVAWGYVQINVPVPMRRWRAYLAAGWEVRNEHLELTEGTATGMLWRDAPSKRKVD